MDPTVEVGQTINVNEDNCQIDGDVNDNEVVFGEMFSLEDGSEQDNAIKINGLGDILNMEMKNIDSDDVGRYDFIDLEVAYLFYYWYARLNGFCARKSKTVKNCKGEFVQQTFVCSREGVREERGLTVESRQRQPKKESRCGCKARFRVHIDINTGRWYVTVFDDVHNHERLDEIYCGLLPAHRKLTVADILQLDNFRKAGIRPAQILGSFANSCGGYDRIGFRKSDLYNQIKRQRREWYSDASGALKFLHGLKKKDPMVYFTYTIDNEGRLEHLFWCDGESQINYEVFGDVVAFDATYRKNKYMCPFVIFSGVNHHNQTIVFATALISNELEETYVWLLKQLHDVMKGKSPVSLITDGDLAIKNAIKRVFPLAHHRLCAWHLLRNATSNVKIPALLPVLRKCMLGDYEVAKFESKWAEMVNQFQLQENKWIQELYEKKNMWATSLIRGNFFAGIRTTSRCESFHSHMGKFVNPRISLTEFVEQFQRCLTYFRFREVESDFESHYGDVVLQTGFRALERSASLLFTNELFFLFRSVLARSSLMRVRDIHETVFVTMFSVARYCDSDSIYRVCYCKSPVQFKCSCLRMESFGLPCDHILTVLVHLNIRELPKCLILDRWSKNAKDGIRGRYVEGSNYWDSTLIARHARLHFLFKEVAELAHCDDDDYKHVVTFLGGQLIKMRSKHSEVERGVDVDTDVVEELVEDPPVIRTKGCGPSSQSSIGRSRRNNRCHTCGALGHNKRSCKVGKSIGRGEECMNIPDESVVVRNPDIPSTSFAGEVNLEAMSLY